MRRVFNMNILLMRPPATFYPGAVRPLISLPIGLLSIAALLERESFHVTVYDAQLNVSNPVTPLGNTIFMGESWESVEVTLQSAAADIIGISCGFSSQRDNALKAAELARKHNPSATIVVGGPHASAVPLDLLQEGSPVDLVCVGEGEYTMLDLVLARQSGSDIKAIPGTVAICSGAALANPLRPPVADLDGLPFPAYHLVNMESYFQMFQSGFADRPMLPQSDSHRAASVITSRGCPFNCIFCSIHLHMGKRWRANSAGYVNSHIKLLTESYGVKHIHFEDDNISFSRERFESIVRDMEGLKVFWDTPNGVRVDTLTEQIVEQCRKSGCIYLVFGVESGNQQVLDSIVDKKLDLSVVRQAAAWCKSAGLDAMAFYVIGFPGETPSDMQETIDYALGLYRDFDVKPNLFLATPLPGTRLEKILLENELMDAPLGSEQLAAMTQGQFSVDGGTFIRTDINQLMKRFVNGYRKIFIVNSIRFLCTRPISIVRLVLLICGSSASMPLMTRIFSALQLKHVSLEKRR